VAVVAANDLQRYACIQCGAESIRPLVALSREGLPPGDPEHNIGYNHSVIVLCDGCGSGFIEVQNHDCFDFEEVFDQSEWFAFDHASGDVLQSTLSNCAQPLEAESRVQSIAIVLKNGLPSFETGT